MEITKDIIIIFTGCITVISAIIGASASLISIYINNKFEERKFTKQLIINAAIEDWKLNSEKLNKKMAFPLEDYIIYMSRLYDKILSKHLSDDEIIIKLKELDNFTLETIQFRYEQLIKRKDFEFKEPKQ